MFWFTSPTEDIATVDLEERRAKSQAAQKESITDRALDKLKTEVTGKVLSVGDSPNEPLYDKARSRPWNEDRRGFPVVICQVQSAEDVVVALSFAQNYNLNLAIASGCHGAHSMDDGAFTIDFIDMRGVKYHEDSGIVTVESGCCLGDVDEVLKDHGVAVPWGTNPYTGVAGLTLSGGAGWLGRRFGLTIDSLVAVDAVLPNGTIIHARLSNEHKDFLWGCKGGGGNFGIITKFHLKTHSLGSNGDVVRYSLVNFAPTISSATGIIKNFRETIKSASNNVSGALSMPCGAPVCPSFWILSGVEGLKRGDTSVPEDLKPAGQMGGWFKIVNKCEVVSYHTEMQHTLVPHQQEGYYYESAIAIRALTDEVIEKLLYFTRTSTPNSLSSIVLFPFSGAIQNLSVEGFPLYDQRQCDYWIIIEGKWDNKKEGKAGREKARTWVQAIKTELEKFQGTFQTSHSSSLGKDVEEEAKAIGLPDPDVIKVWKSTMSRMSDLKKKYDPTNTLHMNRNILPSK